MCYAFHLDLINCLGAFWKRLSLKFLPEHIIFWKPHLFEILTFIFFGTPYAPSIVGLEDVKKAVACQLVGGSRKRMQDGCIKRGDIHNLLIGDPGVGKSQILKFVAQASPIAVYTSGKGSSSAGLTASVLKDPTTQSFVVEVIYILNI